MRIKNIIVIAAFLLGTRANSQIIQVEVSGGLRGSGLILLMNQPIDGKKNFSFVSLAFFEKYYSQEDSKLDENAVFGAVFYNIGKGFSVGPAFAANNLGGFQKKLSFLYIKAGKRFTFAAFPSAVFFKDRIDGEVFVQLQYNRSIKKDWGIFVQLQAVTNWRAFSQIARSFQQFRIGPSYKSFQFGIGTNTDQYGTFADPKFNALFFVRKVI
ncbi:MAG: hypothetical protein HY064_06380 [Bacteroidetes bacterium]|nr:hypothetical protein [Bacteroidota bacterium]